MAHIITMLYQSHQHSKNERQKYHKFCDFSLFIADRTKLHRHTVLEKTVNSL